MMVSITFPSFIMGACLEWFWTPRVSYAYARTEPSYASSTDCDDDDDDRYQTQQVEVRDVCSSDDDWGIV